MTAVGTFLALNSSVFPRRQFHKTREGHWRELGEVQHKLVVAWRVLFVFHKKKLPKLTVTGGER